MLLAVDVAVEVALAVVPGTSVLAAVELPVAEAAEAVEAVESSEFAGAVY